MNITLIDGFYMATDRRIGEWSGGAESANAYILYNANKIRAYLRNLGFTEAVTCAILGNMRRESTLNPALIEGNGRKYLPNRAANISDVPNDVMIDFIKSIKAPSSEGNPFGVGLVQWTGPTQKTTIPYGQKLVSHAIRYGFIWYTGQCQLDRIKWEYENNGQWSTKKIGGFQWYWSNFITITDPELAAHVFMVCYERPTFSQEALILRQREARSWYNYFNGTPIDPDPPLPPDPPEPPPVPPDPPPIYKTYPIGILFNRKTKRRIKKI